MDRGRYARRRAFASRLQARRPRSSLYPPRRSKSACSTFGGQDRSAVRVPVYKFDRSFVDEIAGLIERRSTLSISVTERDCTSKFAAARLSRRSWNIALSDGCVIVF